MAVCCPMEQRVCDLMGQSCSLRCNVRLTGPDLYFVSFGSADGAIQPALFDEPNRDSTEFSEPEQPIQHVVATLTDRLGWQFRQWIAVSLRDVKDVNNLEPNAFAFLLAAICCLFLVFEKHWRKNGNSFLT